MHQNALFVSLLLHSSVPTKRQRSSKLMENAKKILGMSDSVSVMEEVIDRLEPNKGNGLVVGLSDYSSMLPKTPSSVSSTLRESRSSSSSEDSSTMSMSSW